MNVFSWILRAIGMLILSAFVLSTGDIPSALLLCIFSYVYYMVKFTVRSVYGQKGMLSPFVPRKSEFIFRHGFYSVKLKWLFGLSGLITLTVIARYVETGASLFSVSFVKAIGVTFLLPLLFSSFYRPITQQFEGLAATSLVRHDEQALSLYSAQPLTQLAVGQRIAIVTNRRLIYAERTAEGWAMLVTIAHADVTHTHINLWQAELLMEVKTVAGGQERLVLDRNKKSPFVSANRFAILSRDWVRQLDQQSDHMNKQQLGA